MTAKFTALVSGCLLTGCAALASAAAPAPAEPGLSHDSENSVVKVFSTLVHPDLSRPWARAAPQEVTGTGVVIEGKRILTNAHVVQYASQVQVQANQSGDKLAATVVASAPGIDLAVLRLEDESFFARRAALPRANSVPRIKDAVLTYGFPTGGESLSITRGIVSRIEFVSYNLGVSGLRIQVDAPINPGNSGGPAIAAGRMIGLVFSHLVGSENIGYIIPNEEIEQFLKDVAAGRRYAKPAMYDELQTLENPALRAYLKLDSSVRGAVVYRPFEGAGPSPLRQWDVITHIGNTPIDDEGMIQAGDNLRLAFQSQIQKVAHDGTVPLTVVRAGKSQSIRLPVSSHRPLLIDFLAGTYPSYFIYGPLVLSRASLESLQLLRPRPGAGGTNAAALGNPLIARLGEPPDAARDELVVISSPLFPHALSKGYSNPTGEVVKAVNGTPVKSLAQLVALLRDLKDEYVSVDFDNTVGEALVFPRVQTVAATEAILTDNGVRTQGSADMLKIWQGK
ncbi:MAG: S1C family serine protease [Steroidobacteraceae bacterium]